jgi:hypothetical protein
VAHLQDVLPQEELARVLDHPVERLTQLVQRTKHLPGVASTVARLAVTQCVHDPGTLGAQPLHAHAELRAHPQPLFGSLVRCPRYLDVVEWARTRECSPHECTRRRPARAGLAVATHTASWVAGVAGATAYFAQTKPELDLRLLTSHHVDMVIGASAENSTDDLVEAVCTGSLPVPVHTPGRA